ncbi:unnamed protein product [Scytosiphon promiscuus]
MRQVQRRVEEAWEEVLRERDNLEARLVKMGLLPLERGEEDIVCLNVGGELLRVRPSFLAGRAFGDVLDVAWDDDHVPRDKGGFILLDESPVCIKHLVRVAMEDTGESKARVALPADEKPRLDYVSRSLGLVQRNISSVPEVRVGRQLSIDRGYYANDTSTILNRTEFSHFMMTLGNEWLRPGEFHGLELIYRASRDGMNAEAFHSRCNDISSTITLVKHLSSRNSPKCQGVVGGYTSARWAARSGHGLHFNFSADAFIFSLDDDEFGRMSAAPPLDPRMYKIKESRAGWAIHCGSNFGPSFGADDLSVTLKKKNSTAVLNTGNQTYEVPEGSSFLERSGTTVSDIEMFRVHTAGGQKANSPPLPASDVPEEQREYGRKFGVSIAESLMEEKVELENARAELTRAEEKAFAAIAALESVYGPDIASGKQDEVVELSVRGTRVTTLRSMLMACPDSALAAWFSGKWPPSDKDLDGNGRRIVDCDPAVFSKVLDVLRMKKRAGWGASGGSEAAPVPVVVRRADRACFEEFVHKYFPGCEGFVMDLVEPSKAVSADERED